MSAENDKIDYLAERQNGVKTPAFSPIQLSRMLACENEFAVRGIPRVVGKFIFAKLRITLVICGQITPEINPKTPLESTPIDYLAECQNDGKFKGRSVIAPYRVMGPLKGSAVGYRPVGRDHRARLETRELTPQTTPIDYLAERQNGPWGEELTTEEDAERRESGN